MTETGSPFTHSTPALYDRHMGPLLFEPYAKILAERAAILLPPFRAEIERRDPSALDRAVDAVTAALAPWDGLDAPMSAHVVTAAR